MLAIDTNILVRFLTNDHPEQAKRAKALIEAHQVFVATTVLLEAEWVLRSGFGTPLDRIAELFRAFAALPQVTLEDAPRVAKALDWTSAGMDFADALHLAAADGCDGFASFDRGLVKAARSAGVETVREP